MKNPDQVHGSKTERKRNKLCVVNKKGVFLLFKADVNILSSFTSLVMSVRFFLFIAIAQYSCHIQVFLFA